MVVYYFKMSMFLLVYKHSNVRPAELFEHAVKRASKGALAVRKPGQRLEARLELEVPAVADTWELKTDDYLSLRYSASTIWENSDFTE